MDELAEDETTSIPHKKRLLIAFIIFLLILLWWGWEMGQHLLSLDPDTFAFRRRKYAVTAVFLLGGYGLASFLYRLIFCTEAIRLDSAQIAVQSDFRKKTVHWETIAESRITRRLRFGAVEEYLRFTTLGGQNYKFLLLFANIASEDLASLIGSIRGSRSQFPRRANRHISES